MWSKILLCCLVGVAFASNNPAWKDNTEYSYQIRGRTLASLHEVANQHSGIFLKAKLHLQSGSDKTVTGQISDAQYASVHSKLPEDYEAHIPDAGLSYKQLPLSQKPFKILFKNGLIYDVVVSGDIKNWEANFIKSILSQFQLDTTGENLIPSHLNTLPEDKNNNGVFKTMEATVTGEAETLYDIHPLPKYIVQSKPWLAPQEHLKGDGEVIEILKSKNYTHSKQRPTFYFGLSGVEDWEPSTNQMGQFFVRSSNSRAILTGNLKRYTVQSSYTVNKVVMSPTLGDQKKGSVISILNVTLSTVQKQTQKPPEVSNPVSVGNLVYRYGNPLNANVRPKHEGNEVDHVLDESRESTHEKSRLFRFRRFINFGNIFGKKPENKPHEYWQQQQQQIKPTMEKAPGSPFMAFNIGNQGQSISQHPEINIEEKAYQLAEEIGQDLQECDQLVEKHTLSKFTLLVRIVRIMDADKIINVSQKLYTHLQQGPQHASWVIFRDAVAQAGQGPAFLAIEEWIKSGKIQGQEAADAIATMANKVMIPTEEYIRRFFELVKSPVVEKQQNLYKTALLSFAALLNKVYVDNSISHNEYPVHVYGQFRTQEGRQFMRETVIPYFTGKLNQAISQANTHEIHLYIRVLGNIGDRKILPAFEPYLEGKKHISQFQRFLMVVALDKLAQSKPVLARSVLWKIYQNSGESQEIRTAAVYLLMRTEPPTDMLQRMAEYTHVDSQETVNSAVKSSIETAADLQGDEFINFRESARAAKPLLNRKSYVLREAHNHIRNYAVDELKLSCQQTFQSIVGDGSYLPKVLSYNLYTSLAGLKHQLIDAQAVLSSIEEFTNVLRKQTQEYKEARQQSENAKQHQWSSQHVAGLLNLQVEESEQLEGFFNIKMGNLQRMLSFDNHTIEQLPKVINEIEQILQEGTSIQRIKFDNLGEFSISFPTEMGLPFVYAYNRPILTHINGKVQASAQPAISKDRLLHRPTTVSANFEVKTVVHGKSEGYLSFITPFENQQYIAGYKRVLFTNIPLRANVKVDVKNMQVEAELEPLHQKNERVWHYSSVPYTSKVDILKMEPPASWPTTYIIKSRLPQGINTVIGKKECGLAFQVQSEYDQQKTSFLWLIELIQKHSPITALLSFYNNGIIEYHKTDIRYEPQQSSTRKVLVKFGYQQKYRSESQEQYNENNEDLSQVSQTSAEPLARQQDLMNKAAAGISNVNVRGLDASVEFVGGDSIKYIVTGAAAKSNVDPRSRVLFFFKKHSESEPFEVAFSAKSQIPNTNELDLTDSLNQEPKADTQIKIAFGQNYQSSSKVNAQVELRRSEARKQYLLEEPTYHTCKREMLEGNHQLPACGNMTLRANLLDQVNIKIQHENLRPEAIQTIEDLYKILSYQNRLNLLSSSEVGSVEGGVEKDQINLNAWFAPNLEAVNISLKDHGREFKFSNIPVSELSKTLFVVHPVFHLPARVQGQLLGMDNYRRVCVADRTQANTYSGRTYPISLGNKWTVMMQYVATMARQHPQPHVSAQEQLSHQIENYLVLVRDNVQNAQQKEVKITFHNPESQGKLIEITMLPSSGNSESNPKAKVYVGDQEVKFTDNQSYDINDDLVQIYALPNGEVKVEIRDNFYVIYDGSTVKLTMRNGKFRDAIRGLCGQFNNEPITDFLSSDACIVNDPREFIASYALEGQRQKSQNQQCVKKEVFYTNVISDLDAGRQGETVGNRENKCLEERTRYVEQNDQICFTVDQVPVCKCEARGFVDTDVPVHCVRKGMIANLWKSQIDKGGNPDFSYRKQTKIIQMEFPTQCE